MLYNMTPPPAGYVLVTLSGNVSGPGEFKKSRATFYAPRGMFTEGSYGLFNANVGSSDYVLPCCIYGSSDSGYNTVSQGIIHIMSSMFQIFDGTTWSTSNTYSDNIRISVLEPKLT